MQPEHGARAASYRSVLAVPEFLALWAAYGLSLTGEYLLKVAASVVVFRSTDSALLAALTFVVSFAPWLVGGPLLTTAVEALPRRLVLVGSDLLRAVAVLTLVLPGGRGVARVWAVLFVVELLVVPFSAARAALMPQVLDGDAYVVGTGLTAMTAQVASVVGAAAGGALLAVLPYSASFALGAGAFALSAGIARLGLRGRPGRPGTGVAGDAAERVPLLRRSREGVALVLGDPWLRTLVLSGALSGAFVAPEALAAPLAGRWSSDPSLVGALLAAVSAGAVVGALVVTRFVPPGVRLRLIGPLGVLASAALVPVAALPPSHAAGAAGLLALLFVSGCATAYGVPANTSFVLALPEERRAQGFGVAQSVLSVSQGLGALVAGALASATDPAVAVTAMGALGAVLGLGVLVRLAPLVPGRSAEPVPA